MENVGKTLRHLMDQRHVAGVYQQLMEDVLQDNEVQAFLQEHADELSEEEVMKSYAKLYEFVQEKKKYLTQDTTMIAPGYKPQLVLNHHFVDVSYVPTAELLAQQEKQAIMRRVSTFEMPKDVKNAAFDQLELTPERAPAIDQVLAFVEAYQENPRDFHKGLYLSGSFGVGKSYLLGAIAHELAVRGHETLLVHFPAFAGEMKRGIGRGTLDEQLQQAKKVPILMLDDLGADTLSSWIRDEVLGVILQYRMQEQLPVFISSNIAMKDLERVYLTTNNKGEEEPLKAKRLMERVRYLTKEVHIEGRNRRNTN